jgi:hypothetical protein
MRKMDDRGFSKWRIAALAGGSGNVETWKMVLGTLLLGVLFVVAAAACGGGTETATKAVAQTTEGIATTTEGMTPGGAETTMGPGESVTLNWGSGMQSTTGTYTDFMAPWGDWVNTVTNGRVTINWQIDSTIMAPPRSSTVSLAASPTWATSSWAFFQADSP